MSRVFGARLANDVITVARPSVPAVTSERVAEVFSGDYNIVGVHLKVEEYFREQAALLPTKKKELARLRWIRDEGRTVSEKRMASLEVAKVQEWIVKQEQGVAEEMYRKAATPLLQEYQALAACKKERVFGVKKVVDENTEEREMVIVRYLALARRYIDVSVCLDTSNDPICPICEALLVEGVGNCKNCPAFVAKFEIDGSYKDSDLSKSTTRNNYAKHGHIYEAFIKFQGKQLNNLPTGLVEDIDATREAFGVSSSSLTIDMLYQIMRDKQYSSYYDDIYLIYHLITGKKLPDLESIMSELEKDANEFAAIYPDIKPKARLNCLNAHFIRDSFLLRRGLVYPEWQCTFLRTESVDIAHNETMAKAYERLNWGVYKPL